MKNIITCANINQALEATGALMDSHGTDLYIQVTPETTDIINRYEWKANVSTFTTPGKDKFTTELWYDIPFALHGSK